MDQMKCQQCERVAKVHVTENRKDRTVEVTHLCEVCAEAAGYPPGERDMRDIFEKIKKALKKTAKVLRERELEE